MRFACGISLQWSNVQVSSGKAKGRGSKLVALVPAVGFASEIFCNGQTYKWAYVETNG